MKILEVKIIYTGSLISQIVILADFTSVGKPYTDVRAIQATRQQRYGYEYIKPNDKLSQELIERVADFGTEVDTEKEFPGWKKRYR